MLLHFASGYVIILKTLYHNGGVSVNGAKIAVKCLLEQGVTDIFGYPGASILSLLEAVEAEKKLKLTVNTSEQFCAFAADGYARSSGKVGVCLATSGPGATNLVTGIANAYMDSIPLVAITGNVPLALLGTDAFQETDIAGVTMPITKHNFIVKSVTDLAPTLRAAFEIADSGRKGPVLVDIPSDIFRMNAKFDPLPVREKTENKFLPPNLDPVAELINSSERPLVCVGGGVIASGASAEIKRLVEKLDCPVVSTAMGIGGFDSSDAHFSGFLGSNLSNNSNEQLDSCDLLIAVGVRFSDRMLVSLRDHPACRVVHIDIDDAEIEKNLSPCGELVGDAREVLSLLLPLIKKRKPTLHTALRNTEKSIGSVISSVFPDAVYTTEVGLHQVEACRTLTVRRPRTLLTSGGLGAMGYGLPAAIGAATADKSKRVVNIAGDGSFNMNMQELMTAVAGSLPIVQIVVNNDSLGMIESMSGSTSSGGRPSFVKTPSVDYSSLASAFGCAYYYACDLESLEDALINAKNDDRVCLIEYKIKETL